MTERRRLVRLLGLLTAVCVPAALATPVSAQEPVPVPVPVLEWTPCEEGFECATARVPRDYRRPDGPTLPVALIRRPALDRERRIGSLFVNPGGPGGSGVDYVRQGYLDFPEAVRQRFDLVGFDPRGVGRSVPLRCWGTARYRRAFARARGRDSAAALPRTLDEGRAFDRACRRASGELLPYVGTAFVARDLDLLREAVGDERLTYLGYSFGTYIGTVYADLFPSRVRALVLDGAYDPRAYANHPYAYDRRQFLALEGSLRRFLRWCERSPRACGFGRGRAGAAFDRLVARLDARPARVRNEGKTTRVNGFALLYSVTFALNDGRAGWPRLGAALKQASARRPRGSLLEGAVSPGLFEFLGQNGAIECADRLYPRDRATLARRLAAHARLGRRLGPAFAFGPPGYDHSHAAACAQWTSARVSRHSGPFTAAGSPPILVIGTTGDPDTPYPDAVTLSRTLQNARLLTFAGEGHTGFGRSGCVTDLAGAYLLEGALPAPGARCADERPPAARSTAHLRSGRGD